jgi:hypothetical protein
MLAPIGSLPREKLAMRKWIMMPVVAIAVGTSAVTLGTFFGDLQRAIGSG